jgi:hypothetical protein
MRKTEKQQRDTQTEGPLVGCLPLRMLQGKVQNKTSEAEIPSHTIYFINSEKIIGATCFDLTGSSSGPTDTFLNLRQNYI